jgi:hypothetical protein
LNLDLDFNLWIDDDFFDQLDSLRSTLRGFQINSAKVNEQRIELSKIGVKWLRDILIQTWPNNWLKSPTYYLALLDSIEDYTQYGPNYLVQCAMYEAMKERWIDTISFESIQDMFQIKVKD